MAKRLDRALVDIDWRGKFPEAFLETLCHVYSNHHPILLRCGGLSYSTRAKPFHFEAA